MTARRPATALLASGLALCALVGPLGGIAEAKKPKQLDLQATPNATIPDGSAAGNGELDSTIKAGNKFKGLKVRDVNVTFQTTGLTPTAAGDLLARLTSPAGASTLLVIGLSGQSIGPLTLDDETSVTLNSGPPPAQFRPHSLFSPYQGVAQPGNILQGMPLAIMDGERVKGNWVLTMFDQAANNVSVLNSWRLQVRTGKPYATD